MDTRALSFNGHLELEIGKHPERTYLASLLNSQPQFAIEHLQGEIQAEAEHWMTLFSDTAGKSFLQVFESVEHIFDALKHEGSALKDIEKGLAAHRQADWGEASKYYGSAINDLHFAISDWNFAVHAVADDSPFDHYYPSKDEREKHNIEEPPRARYEDMREISPLLFRIFRNVDRVFVLGQELVQRQITCLTIYMQESEKRQFAERHTEETTEK